MAQKNTSFLKNSDRFDREAEGLRSNLQRRKQQQKEREAEAARDEGDSRDKPHKSES